MTQLIKRKHVDHTGALIEGYSYSYDALGRRVRKSCYTPQTYPQGITRYYLYDEENIIAILDENKSLLATIIHDEQTDTPLSITTYDNDPKTQPLLSNEQLRSSMQNSATCYLLPATCYLRFPLFKRIIKIDQTLLFELYS